MNSTSINAKYTNPISGLFIIIKTVIVLQLYILSCCYNIILFTICKEFVKNLFDIPDKVNCMGFTLSTKVKHVRPLLATISNAPKLLSWLKGVKNKNIHIEHIEIMDVDFFGSNTDPTCLTFLKIKCSAFDAKNNLPVDDIVIIRGSCAVVCTVIEDSDENEYILTVEQFRTPMKARVEEFLVGMCDEHEVENPRTGKTTTRNTPNLNAVLMKEFKEEAGLELKQDDPKLFYLGDIMLSPGVLDEKAKMFAWYTKLSNEKIEELLSRKHGEFGTNEQIRLHLYPIEEFHNELNRIGDAKTEVAFIRMLNKDEFEPDDDVSDEDYVYETDDEDDDSDEADDSDDQDEDDDSDDEANDSDDDQDEDDDSDDQDEESELDDQSDDEVPDLVDSDEESESDDSDKVPDLIDLVEEDTELDVSVKLEQESDEQYIVISDGNNFDENLLQRKNNN